MFDSLFGAEMPLAVRFFLAFLIVLGLIGVTAWAVRRFGSGRLGGGAARGRQPRLAVIDYASVDGRRRLILVRRDNVEHLLMIGGPTDVVVEPNIVRAVAAPRDVGARPPAGIEALPRAIPLPEAGNGHGNNHGAGWPLQPEPAAPARPSPRLEPLPDEMLRPEPSRSEPRPELPRPLSSLAEPPRPQRDTLAALADELSSRAPIPSRRPPPSRPAPDVTQSEPHADLQPEPESQPEAPRSEMPRPEPRKPAPPLSAPIAASPPTPAPPIAPTAEAATTPDQSLADMAQRLEAALRKPLAETKPQAAPARPAAAESERAEPAPPPAPPMSPRMPRPAAAKPRAEARPNQGKATVYDSLEQEMASLLGRPTKT